MEDVLVWPPAGVIAGLVAIGYYWAGLSLVSGQFTRPPDERPDYANNPSFFRTLRIVLLWPLGQRPLRALWTLLSSVAATAALFLALGYLFENPWWRMQGMAALFAVLSLSLLFTRRPNPWP